MGFSVYQVV